MRVTRAHVSTLSCIYLTEQDVKDHVITQQILNFPLLPQQLFNPLVFDVTGGPAPILGASGILSYMSFRLIKEQNPQFSVHEVQEAICLSNDIPLQYFIQDSEPLNWNTDLFGSFRPCTVVRMRCPPSHKSDSNPANWKFAVIVFSDIPNQRLMIRGPLSKILFWKCQLWHIDTSAWAVGLMGRRANWQNG